MPQQIVGGGKIEIQLTDERRIEGNGLEFDHDIAAQLQVIEQQVDDEVLIPDFEWYLPAYECESGTEFQQKSLDVIHQRLLDLSLTAGIGRAEEVEQVGVFEDLGCKIGLTRRQRGGEIGERFALPRMDAGLDLECEDVVRPPLFNDLTHIPQALDGVVEFLQQRDVVVPGDLCKRRLHNCALRPG